MIIILVVGYLLLFLAVIILASYNHNNTTISSVKQSRDYYVLPPHWSKYPFWSIYGEIKPVLADRTGRFDLTFQTDHDLYYLTYSIEYDSLTLKLKGPMEQLLGAFEWYVEATDKTIIGQLYYYPSTGEDKKIVVYDQGWLNLHNPQNESKPVYLVKLKDYYYITDPDFIPLFSLQFPMVNSGGRVISWPQIWNPLLYQVQYRASIGLTMVIKDSGKSVALLDSNFGRLDPITYRTSIPWFYTNNPWKLSPVSVPDGNYYFVSNHRDTLILSSRSALTGQLTLDGLATIDTRTCLGDNTNISIWLNSTLVIRNNKIFIGSSVGSSLQSRPLGTSNEGIISIIGDDDVSNGTKLQFQIFQDEQGFIVLADSSRNPMLLPKAASFDQIDRTIITNLPIGWYSPTSHQPVKGYLYQLTQIDNLLNRSMEDVLRRVWT